MAEPSHMPRYDVRNDGIGPYAVFYCEICDREYRSQPQVVSTVTRDVGRQAMGGLLRNIPILGGAISSNVANDNIRYTTSLTQQQLDKAWEQAKARFRECPTCLRIACLSCYDEPSGYCRDDSPRSDEIAEARAGQAGAMVKGFMGAFGLGEVLKKAGEAAQQAPAATVADACPNCGKATGGAKFCPECGTKVERAPEACPNCGTEAKGAKFCPECGTKIV